MKRNAGDEGQRFEVRALDGGGEEFVVGWTNRADGSDLVRVVKLHPVWHSPRVIDRVATKKT